VFFNIEHLGQKNITIHFDRFFGVLDPAENDAMPASGSASLIDQRPVQHPVSGFVGNGETQTPFILIFRKTPIDTNYFLFDVGGAEHVI